LATWVLLPALLLPQTGYVAQRLVSAGSRAASVTMEELAGERAPRRWRERAASAGATIATAVVLAMPRGPARAATLPPPGGEAHAPVSSQASPTVRQRLRSQQQQPLAFLGVGRRYKNLKPPLPPREAGADEIDMDAIVPKGVARRYTSRSYIFSDGLTRRTDLADELEQLDEVKSDRAWERTASTLTTYSFAAGSIYLTVRGLQGVERWMKQQELKDIEEERELTGQYISVDAGDVDSVIDPRTGKNLTLVKRKEPSGKKTVGNATETGEEAVEQAPWILRVLGRGGAQAADDEDFFAPTTAASAPRKDPSSGGGAPGADGDGEGEGGGDGTDDDTDDLDELNDLLG